MVKFLVDSGVPQLRRVSGLMKSCLMPRMSQRNHGLTSMDVNMLYTGMILRLMLMDEIVMKESKKQVDFYSVKGQRESVPQVNYPCTDLMD